MIDASINFVYFVNGNTLNNYAVLQALFFFVYLNGKFEEER